MEVTFSTVQETWRRANMYCLNCGAPDSVWRNSELPYEEHVLYLCVRCRNRWEMTSEVVNEVTQIEDEDRIHAVLSALRLKEKVDKVKEETDES